MPTNILVVENETLIAETVAEYLSCTGHSPTIAYDADDAARFLSTVRPDLILLNWKLSSNSGVPFASQLRTDDRTKDIPLIMLGTPGARQTRAIELASAADGYVARPSQREELVACVRAVLRHHQIPRLTDDIANVGCLSVDPATRRVFAIREGAKVQLRLRPIELRLLYFLMTHPGRAFTRAELIDHVANDRILLTQLSVNSYIKGLRSSLRPVACDSLIETVRGFGYRFAFERSAVSC
ncbi:winged helix-turn-helix domain-containing protein [Paraburkholderia fungorum]|uniref:Winged helix-turn-helix domain-containing protein n=1 Tax=Paraburkholderia fungorum TaxID=134537 RepID=A0AAP5QB13_9BURK|nr:winged helix-turn-helix domain-containing protein [Paraburkholderia fungorum]MDT8840186.1 winged helix-turn-helix domain-containing protein [Paraburkholderia fungorum]